MKFRSHQSTLRLLAACAMLLFVGDLAADALADLSGAHCATESSQSAPDHEQAPCSHCACATHAGAVAIADDAIRLGRNLAATARLLGVDEATPPRRPASIDYPPQLA